MRALLLVLDSVGVGQAPDAAAYGDTGADTLGHILAQCPHLELPNLESLGLGPVMGRRGGDAGAAVASYGRMQEKSAGKDTTTGHWELAGVIFEEAFAVFERFPAELVQAIEEEANLEFIGNYAQSGTTILEELGAEHCQSGKPILYTSADSVLQIAAHEEVIPIERLYRICEIARKHADAARIGRVIARPFNGSEGSFRRSANRHDYSLKPPRTILDALVNADVPVSGVGKIGDIFAGHGLTSSFPTATNGEGMERIAALWRADAHGFIFANLVDFDMLFG
ncbi:MAG: phosphopentomutase, partial [Verrucomicrobiota bacterium]|nr:phosphopentomutase [Verrucomicrobiota bacterium]